MDKYSNMEVFKRTSDDWCPPYALEDESWLARVSFSGPIPSVNGAPYYVTCVWGADDMGMELFTETKGVAWIAFIEILAIEVVTIEALSAIGLVRA